MNDLVELSLTTIAGMIQRREVSPIEVAKAHLERIANRFGVSPACKIGRMPVYGPVQIRQFFAAVEAASAA